MYEKLTAYRKDFDEIGFWTALAEVSQAVCEGNDFSRLYGAPVKAGIELNEESFMKADVSSLPGQAGCH